jgi:hypothetical protein
MSAPISRPQPSERSFGLGRTAESGWQHVKMFLESVRQLSGFYGAPGARLAASRARSASNSRNLCSLASTA